MISKLAERLHAVRWRTLNGAAQDKLLLCVLANLVVAIAGRSALRLPRPAAGTGHLLLDGGQTGSAREAAFFNAALMHARTQDDFHPVGNLHLATVIVPAALAEAERQHASGDLFLDAVAAGYATAVGLSRQYSPLTTPRGLRSTCLYSAMGAAVAVATLRGQDARQLGNTLSLATQSSFGTTQCWRDGSDEYQLHVANAASQALLCAELTEAGVIGGEHALDGPSGFYPALSGTTPQFENIVADFEPNAAIVETVLKRYPVSGICQPVVRLAERLATQRAGRGIARLVLEMTPFEMNYPGTLNAGPVFKSFSDRLMSARFCVGSVMEAGRFDFDAFVRPATAELDGIIAVVDVLGAADLGTLSCRMRVELNDGAVLAGELRNGGNELALDRSTIDEWCAQLWAGAGRTPDAYVRTRDAVARLAAGSFADLRATLLLAG